MRNGNNNFKRIQAAGLAGILIAWLSVVGLPAEPVSAANGWDVDLNAGGSVEASSVSITMGDATVNGQLNASSTDPNKSAGLVKRTASVEIGATDGYTVTLSGNPNLTGVNSNNKIPTVTSNTTLAQMNNQWGWYTAEGDVDCSALQTMKQMKSTGDQIAAGTLNAKTTKQFTMCFGAKVNGNQAADTYSNTVTLSVVAQPKVVGTFSGITTMQEMTVEVCNAAKENDTARLTDNRDGTKYWVTKLADGNCWMSQNLDLNIKSSGNIVTINDASGNPTQTVDWGNSSYPPQATSSDITTGGFSDAPGNHISDTYSWNLGGYVLNAPTLAATCASNSTGLGACSAQGFVNVSGWTASDDPNFYRRELYNGTDGSTCTKSANSAVNTSATGACRVYDAHYLVGNYYQHNAATAGTTTSSYNAAGSICPKNWRLPDGASDTRSGTFGYMLKKYGVNSGVTGSVSVGANVYNYNIALSPLFWVRSGYISPSSKQLSDAGQDGRYWSSIAAISSYYAHGLSFGSTSVSPSASEAERIGRYYGNSVRCYVGSFTGGYSGVVPD